MHIFFEVSEPLTRPCAQYRRISFDLKIEACINQIGLII